MTTRSGPIYEWTVSVGEDSAGAIRGFFETCRSDHIGDAGIDDIRVFENRDSLVLQIAFRDRESLDAFLSGPSSALMSALDAVRPESSRSTVRILEEDSSTNLPSDSACLNCGTPLRGQYCGQCGQRARSRLISLWELVRDAFGDLFEIDSRLWQTLIPLLFRPGKLTADYLQGRRARFMPPFRSYLVLSLLFFVVAFFDPEEEFALFFEDPPTETAEHVDERKEADQPAVNIQIDGDDVDEDCEWDVNGPEWLERRMTPERMQRICESVYADNGKQLIDKVMDNIPAALIILLPIMALILKVLYPLSRRYYVEHVLFFVHFHAFFFLILSLQILWSRLIDAIGLHDVVSVLPIVVTSFYIPIYLFKAMRRVYGQGFFVTLLKYLILVVSYHIGFSLMLLGAFALAAFSI